MSGVTTAGKVIKVYGGKRRHEESSPNTANRYRPTATSSCELLQLEGRFRLRVGGITPAYEMIIFPTIEFGGVHFSLLVNVSRRSGDCEKSDRVSLNYMIADNSSQVFSGGADIQVNLVNHSKKGPSFSQLFNVEGGQFESNGCVETPLEWKSGTLLKLIHNRTMLAEVHIKINTTDGPPIPVEYSAFAAKRRREEYEASAGSPRSPCILGMKRSEKAQTTDQEMQTIDQKAQTKDQEVQTDLPDVESDYISSCYDVVQALKCPVCFDVMSPPIYMCSSGHSICDKCQSRPEVAHCPSCRKGFLSSGRNYSLENVTDFVYYPCLSSECNRTFLLKDRDQYSEVCRFREIDCLKSGLMIPPCNWHGKVTLLREHLLSKHKDDLILPCVSPMRIRVCKFDRQPVRSYLIDFDGRLFRFTVQKSSAGLFYACLLLFGAPEDAERYKFYLFLNSKVAGIEYKSSMESSVHGDRDETDGKCVCLTTEAMLRKNGCINSNGELRFRYELVCKDRDSETSSVASSSHHASTHRTSTPIATGKTQRFAAPQ